MREAKKIVLKQNSIEKWTSACSVETIMLNNYGGEEERGGGND